MLRNQQADRQCEVDTKTPSLRNVSNNWASALAAARIVGSLCRQSGRLCELSDDVAHV